MLEILRNTKRTYQILFLDETIALKWLVRFKAPTDQEVKGQNKMVGFCNEISVKCGWSSHKR